MLKFECKRTFHSKEQFTEYNILKNIWILNLSLLILIVGHRNMSQFISYSSLTSQDYFWEF